MSKKNKKIILALLLATGAVVLPGLKPSAAYAYGGDESTRFDGYLDLKAFVESNRKEYFDTIYSYDSPIPTIAKKEYDKSFYGVDSNLNFSLKTDLNDTSFFDIKENLFVRHYNREDPNSLDYSSNRNNELDQNLRLTFGIAAGIDDYLQVDYNNNIADCGEFDSLNYTSNKGRALVLHDFGKRFCAAFTGSYEERKYDTDTDLSYKEGRAGFEFSTLIASRDEYVQIPASTRGEKYTFERVPGAMAARHVIDYYTTYKKNPHDDDPTAKYICNQTRGELYIRGFGELAQRDRVNLDNDCDESVFGLETIYKTTDNMRFRLHDVYLNQDYQRESNVKFLHDGHSNYFAISVDYDCTKNFSQSLTYSNEIYRYDKAAAENNKANSVTYESFYSNKKTRASVIIGAVMRKFDQPSDTMPDETEKRIGFTYDYDIMKTLTFKLKAEYADLDYHDHEDHISSNYKRKTWRVALEKGFCKTVSCEIAYQNNREEHEQFTQNDIEEKTVGLSLIGKF